jgi:hypothetical protein
MIKHTFLLFLTVGCLVGADVVTVDPAGVTTIAGTAPTAAPSSGEVKLGGGDLQIGRSAQAIGAQVVRGDDPRLTSSNFCPNGSAEIDTVGWTTYANAAASEPVSGTGGVASISWTRSVTNPLAGSGSFLFAKDGANRQGNGVSCVISLPTGLTTSTRVFVVEFDCETSGYSAGDVAVCVLDAGTGTPLPVGGGSGMLLNGAGIDGAGPHRFAFMTSGKTSLRLCFHVSSTSAAAYTMLIDNIRVYQSVDELAGQVMQIQQQFDVTPRSTTSTSLVFSGISVQMPNRLRTTKSKVLIRVAGMVAGSGNQSVLLGLYRQVNGGTPTSINQGRSYLEGFSTAPNNAITYPIGIELLDAPATTGIVTYLLYFATTANTAYIGRNTANSLSTPTTLTLQEFSE